MIKDFKDIKILKFPSANNLIWILLTASRVLSSHSGTAKEDPLITRELAARLFLLKEWLQANFRAHRTHIDGWTDKREIWKITLDVTFNEIEIRCGNIWY